MSCDGWGVGMRLIARREIVVPGEKDPKTRVAIQSGAQGMVAGVRPKAHLVLVHWDDGRRTVLTEDHLSAVEPLAEPTLEA